MSFFTVHFRMKHVFSEAEGYLELGMPLHALKVLDRCNDKLPQYQADLLYLRAEALRELDRYEEAIETLKAARDEAPYDIRIKLCLGWCYLGLQEPEKTLETLEGAEKHAFECRQQYFFLRGVALRNLERYEDAIAELREALKLDPNDVRTRMALGWCYLGIGQADQTLRVLERVLEASPDTKTQYLFLQGVALRDLDRFDEAVVPLEQASREDPQNVHIWLTLGWCYKRAGHIDAAIEALEQARVTSPEDPIVPYNLACYWSLAGNREKALNYLAEAIELDPTYRHLTLSEPDFDPLRKDETFRALISA